jgi:hypothetical protein
MTDKKKPQARALRKTGEREVTPDDTGRVTHVTRCVVSPCGRKGGGR